MSGGAILDPSVLVRLFDADEPIAVIDGDKEVGLMAASIKSLEK